MTVFLYCRVSSAGQEDNTSLADQEERGRAFVKSQGWSEPVVIKDVASGRNLDRIGLLRLRDAVREGDRVVVLKLDRLSRSIVSGAPLIDEWSQAGVSLHSVSEPIETGSAMGRSMLRMILNFAQTEREVIAERMAAGKAKNASVGRFNGSPVPFGYRRSTNGPSDFVAEPREAKIVQDLFRRFARGGTGVRRLKRLTGCPLSEAGIGDLLANPFYVGQIRYAGTIRPNNHEALVSARTFNQAQKVKAGRAKANAKRNVEGAKSTPETLSPSRQR